MVDNVAAVVRFPLTASGTVTPAAGGEVRAALFRSYGANLPPQLDVTDLSDSHALLTLADGRVLVPPNY